MAQSNIRVRALKKIDGEYQPVIQFTAAAIGLDGIPIDGKTEDGRAAIEDAVASGMAPHIDLVGSGRALDQFNMLLSAPSQRNGDWKLEFASGYSLAGTFSVERLAIEGMIQGQQVGGISLSSIGPLVYS